MCARYTLTVPQRLRELFPRMRFPAFVPRYNIAPTQQVLAVREARGEREAVQLRWGLLPSWSEASLSGTPLINARSETAADRPAFRNAFRQRRCLIPADGFFEWQKPAKGGKQPFLITLKDERPFAFAGLWERCRAPDQSTVE